ncbi:MAG: HIT domain-containing protein [Candidatus Baltobacteraceae bacterium]
MSAEGCVFCKIVSGEIPARTFERTGDALVIADIEPAAPAHFLVIPTRHVATLGDFAAQAEPHELGSLLALAAKTGREASPSGYRVVVNEGRDANQIVFHLHLHVLAGRPFGWPPG